MAVKKRRSRTRKTSRKAATSKPPTPAFAFVEDQLRPMKRRGGRKKAGRRNIASASPTRRTGRGPVRPPKTTTHDGILAAITELQRERDRIHAPRRMRLNTLNTQHDRHRHL